MDGKHICEYARKGKPLPREIQARPMHVEQLELLEFTTNHNWSFPTEVAEDETRLAAEYVYNESEEGKNKNCLPVKVRSKVIKGLEMAYAHVQGKKRDKSSVPELSAKKPKADSTPEPKNLTSSTNFPCPPIFTLRIISSSLLYIRSLIHDLGKALGSSAHMVSLVRTQHGRYRLDDKERTIDWEVLAKDKEKHKAWLERLKTALERFKEDYPKELAEIRRKKERKAAWKRRNKVQHASDKSE